MKISRTQFLGSLGAAAGAGLLAPIARAERSTPQATPPATRDAPQVAGALDSQKFRAAVVAGDIDTVGRYLATDPALRYANDDEGRSVFILAHLAGHPEIAELFVELGLPLDIVEASIVGDWDRVNELGQVAPGLVNADHPIGGTAMYAAALFGHGVPMFRLNGVGGDPNGNPRLEKGFTPVRAAMNCRDPIGAERAATYLIGNGGDVNAAQRGGDSVLHGAVKTGNPYLVEYVIRKGGRIDATDTDGRTPLDVALSLPVEKIANLMRNAKRIPLDMPRNDPASSRLAYDTHGEVYAPRELAGRPALLLSRIVGVSHGDFDAVRELISSYPDLVHATATTQEMAVEASAHMVRMTDSVRFFLDHGAPLSLPTCIRLGEIERARALIQEHPARIRERGPHDFALTYYPTIGGGRADSAELLVEHGVDVNAEGQLGETGLHWAARAGQVELVEFWIDHGAEIDTRTRDSHKRSPGATPLDFARAAERPEVVELLKSRGAS